MKKIISAVLAAIVLLSSLMVSVVNLVPKAEAADINFKCGDNITWTVDTISGVLTLNGTGKTDEYGIGSAPWDIYADYITSVVVSEGITHLLEGTFNKLNKAANLTLPSTIEGIYTTAGMPYLENIDFSNGKNLYYVSDSFCSKSVWYKNIPDGSLIYFGHCFAESKAMFPKIHQSK